MWSERFFEDNQEALDRFLEEYKKHLEKEKNQFRFMKDDYIVKEEEVQAINDNVVRIRQVKEEMQKKTLLELRESYSKRMVDFADQYGFEQEGEVLIQDLEKAALILNDLACSMGEWMHTYVKYFGCIDALDGVHSNQGILGLVHSNSSYKAIHLAAFRQMLILRPEPDVLFFIVGTEKVNPFLKTRGLVKDRSILVPDHYQAIYDDFFGVHYHIRLLLCGGDSLLIAPSYIAQKEYNAAKLQETFLYAE